MLFKCLKQVPKPKSLINCSRGKTEWMESTSRRLMRGKDVVLHIIGIIGTAGGTGSVIEYCISTCKVLSLHARWTQLLASGGDVFENMSMEALCMG